ncbi:MAG: hypothetical protein QGF87_07360 [Woeseiaceae bacterium]|jgi:hypothetical protein|nr:hypothetical protein [Woeseiaceae bacterium]
MQRCATPIGVGIAYLASRSLGFLRDKLSFRPSLLSLFLLTAVIPANADPHTDYLLYCRGCHLHTGDPVPDAQIPSLKTLVPLIESPEGREYIVRVPGVSQADLSDTRLAALLNWVFTQFNADTLPADFEPYTAEEVGTARVKVLVDPLRAREAILSNQ